MTEYLSKEKLSEFSRSDFAAFVGVISDSGSLSDTELDGLVRHFDQVVPHPSKRDLLFWPEEGADDTPDGIVAEIERYCQENGLPGFKDSTF